jgi:hypothetical protein
MRQKPSRADDLKDALVFPDAYGRKPDQGLSVAEVLRRELERHNAANETPGLNDSRLLTALGSPDADKSVREEVAKILHDWRQGQQ